MRTLLPVLATVLAACGGAEAPSGRARHLLLLSVDTLRTDRLSCYGGPNPTSPHVDRLAREGTRVANAYAPGGQTLPTLASLFTSKHPPEHGMIDNTFSLRESEELLAERLRAAGFRNRAFVANPVLQTVRSNLEQGFDLEAYTFVRNEDELTEQAHAYLRDEFGNTGARDFLWIHYFKPHHPYQPAPPQAKLFLDPSYDGPFDASKASIKEIYAKRIELSAADLNNILGHYDGAVRYVDDCIGRLLATLESSGHAAETLVVFAADHGEELYTHNHYFYHGNSIYRAVTWVPLVFRQPGSIAAGRTIEELVSTLDVAPTLLAWLGVPSSSQAGNELRGNDLSDMLAGGVAPAREFAHAFFEDDIFTIRSRDWCYVWNPEEIHPDGPPKAGEFPIAERELYDLRADPDEQVNVLAEHPDVVQRLHVALERFDAALQRVEPFQGGRAELMLPRLRELAELGYIEFDDIDELEARGRKSAE